MTNLSGNILYEDEDILAINKPAGLVVHPDGRTEEASVSEWFARAYPGSQGVGEPMDLGGGKVVERPGVVHRIDRETSGVLLLAKTTRGHEVLKKQFQDRGVEKVYHLFVHGLVKDDIGSINLPISRSKRDFRKWVALARRSLGEVGRGDKREALTYYKVLKRDSSQGVSLVEAKPKTGRTHQIRVHFKAVHHPILGDKLYGSSALRSLSEAWGFGRLALHARSIAFKNVSGEEIRVEAPYPEDFQKAMDSIGFSVLD